jgi:hypothetical protein
MSYSHIGNYRQWYLGHLALFAFANLFLLQPWTKDNIKIINIYMFGASSVIGLGLVRLFNRDNTGVKGRRDKLSAPSPIASPHQRFEQTQSIMDPIYNSPVVVKFNEFRANPFFQTSSWATTLKVIVVLVVISLCFTGVINVIREPNLHWKFQDNEDLAMGQWIIDHTDPHVRPHLSPPASNRSGVGCCRARMLDADGCPFFCVTGCVRDQRGPHRACFD